MSDARAPEPSPFRRTRVLLTLGTSAGTLGTVFGFGLGWNGADQPLRILEDLANGRGINGLALFSFLALACSVGIAGAGHLRERPFHALKAAGIVGSLSFVTLWWFGRLCAEWASC